MSDFWIITTHKFFRHTTQAAAETEAERLRGKEPKKTFAILRIKGSVNSSRSAKIIAALEESNAELLEALKMLVADEESGALFSQRIQQARAAIAKAEGRAE